MAHTRRGGEYGSRARGAREGGIESSERLARALGWFSVGLGLAELVDPGRVARLIGVADRPERRLLLRALGLRELTSGAGILARRRPTGWLWSRVGGDAIDLGFLAQALGEPHANRTRVATASAAVAGVTALDVYASERMRRQTAEPLRVRRAITVYKPREEVYGFWRDFEKLPRFMQHLDAVEVLDGRRSRWRAKAPAGTTVEWEAETVEDLPPHRIAWRSIDGASVPNRGSVEFQPAPGGRGTEIVVDLEYQPPGGSAGAAVAKLFGQEPGLQIGQDLRRLKQLLETGEITTAESPSGRRRPSLFGGNR